MKITTILDHIESGHVALPEFQRGYVWNREQVRGLMFSLYKRYPIGGLMVWVTESEGATHRGDGALAPGVVKLLLDGQQRITTLYGIVRGHAPKFFDGNVQTFTGLHFNLADETFEFYAPAKMKDNPLWVDVTKLMKIGAGTAIQQLLANPILVKQEDFGAKVPTYLQRLNAVDQVKETELHVDEVTGKDKTVDIVVDIFNRVNSGGTKLSKGDLALAKICAAWPEARDTMKAKLAKWRRAGFYFELDWLLRCVNTVLTNSAFFSALKDVTTTQFQDALTKTEKAIDYTLNLVSSRLGIDHDRVLGGRYAFPLMVRFVHQRGGHIDDPKDRAKLLYWYVHSFLWGRYSSSVESTLSQDLTTIGDKGAGLDGLITNLRQNRGDLRLKAEDFGGATRGSRFYPLLYLMTRAWGARDWDLDIELKLTLLGNLSSLQLHHIFPKAQLNKTKEFSRAEVNALANFTFLTQETNLKVSDRLPADYLPEFARRHPDALKSHWLPFDPDLWEIEKYEQFLSKRRELLADAANRFLDALANEGVAEPEDLTSRLGQHRTQREGGFADADEERRINEINDWVDERGLPRGTPLFELTDRDSGALLGVLDLAWPDGLQAGLSEPVALIIDEDEELEEACSQAGYKFFTSVPKFRRYVTRDILTTEPA
jgi:hypothetical protein